MLPLSPAFAQRVRPLAVEDMARQADVIGVATVVDTSAHLDPRTGFVYTDFRLSFSEVWKGEASPAFILMKPGGVVQGVGGATPGHEYELKTGEKLVVFATPSNLGNHVPIGMHQGIYRVGKDEGAPIYRVTQNPHGPGKTADGTLLSLKGEVFQSLGKPFEAPKTPDRPPAPRTEKSTAPEAPVPPPAQDPGREARPPEAPGGSPRWLGALIVGLLLAAVTGVLFSKRKTQP